ncbi:MAG: RNA polymerase sigma factor [Candidatus Aminicenantales bacterium]
MDPQQFDRLYGRYSSAVFSFAFHLTQNRQDAEELFQDTWLRVVRSFPEKLDMESAKTWLFTITANLFRDSLRRRKVRERSTSWQQAVSSSLPETEVERMERKETARAIWEAMGSLPDHHRLVLVLKELAGFTQEEISEMLGMPIGSVKSSVFRAIRKMRDILAPLFQR